MPVSDLSRNVTRFNRDDRRPPRRGMGPPLPVRRRRHRADPRRALVATAFCAVAALLAPSLVKEPRTPDGRRLSRPAVKDTVTPHGPGPKFLATRPTGCIAP